MFSALFLIDLECIQSMFTERGLCRLTYILAYTLISISALVSSKVRLGVVSVGWGEDEWRCCKTLRRRRSIVILLCTTFWRLTYTRTSSLSLQSHSYCKIKNG